VTQIVRDRYDRPLIAPLREDGTPDMSVKPVPYTRVSKLAKALDDLNQLMAWKARKTAEGLVRRPDILTLVSGAIATGDPDNDWATKKALNGAVEQAVEAAGASRGSTAGTGFHSLTEAVDGGKEPLFVPEADRLRLEQYREATSQVEWLDIECFVVNDIVMAAGTFDRLGRLPDGRVVVADLKSGKSEADYPFATCVQIATYAHGRRYNPETGERTIIHEDLDLTTGLLIHLPPSGGCFLYELDLIRGWEAAKLAVEVRRCQKWKARELAQEVSFFPADATMTHDKSAEGDTSASE
jgi:hypothetical protein